MPVNACRSGTRLRPGYRYRRSTLGNNGSIRSHSPSLTKGFAIDTVYDNSIPKPLSVRHSKEIPRLTEPGQLAQIIDRRGEFADPPVASGELLSEAGLHRLMAIHMSERAGGLRATLGVFHQALGLAISDASDSVGERHITAADTLAGG
jgi:hypothetical protein